MIFRLLVFLLLGISVSFAHAKNSSKLNRELLLGGQVQAVLDDYYNNEKINDIENAKYYVISLISSGEILEAKNLLKALIEEYPEEKHFKRDLKKIYIFEQDFANAAKFGLNEIEQAQLALKKIFFDEEFIPCEETYQKILEINNRTLYFPSSLEYLYLFIKFTKAYKEKFISSKASDLIEKVNQLDQLINKAKTEVETEAKKIIEKNQHILFPKTLDFYELAEAYRILALVNLMKSGNTNKFGKESNLALAESQRNIQKTRIFLNMAQIHYNKMRSIWLIEDTKFYKPIMKQYEKVTRFGYVLPQWIIALKRINY